MWPVEPRSWLAPQSCPFLRGKAATELYFLCEGWAEPGLPRGHPRPAQPAHRVRGKAQSAKGPPHRLPEGKPHGGSGRPRLPLRGLRSPPLTEPCLQLRRWHQRTFSDSDFPSVGSGCLCWGFEQAVRPRGSKGGLLQPWMEDCPFRSHPA